VSLLTRIILEAEAASARDFMREEGVACGNAGSGSSGRFAAGACASGAVGASGTRASEASVRRAPSLRVHVVGRSPQPAKPIRSMKSRIVPEPDQIQSAPPVRREIPER
jgi:hypothetical protein